MDAGNRAVNHAKDEAVHSQRESQGTNFRLEQEAAHASVDLESKLERPGFGNDGKPRVGRRISTGRENCLGNGTEVSRCIQPFYTNAVPDPADPRRVWLHTQWSSIMKVAVDYVARDWRVLGVYAW